MEIKTATEVSPYDIFTAGDMTTDCGKPRNRTSFIVTQQRTCDAKKILNELKIDWELDLNKMNFGDLRDSGLDYIKNFNPKIDTKKIEIWYNGLEGDAKDIFKPADIDIILDLIEFVQTGKKVIPPVIVIPVHILDGEKKYFRPVILDGVHRIRLARYLGEAEVPVISYDYTRKYIFTKAKWKIERNTKSAKYKVCSLSGYNVYTFKMSEWKLSTNEIGDFFLDR